jgi:hypothetical protein
MNIFIFDGGRYFINPYFNSYFVRYGICILMYNYINGILNIVIVMGRIIMKRGSFLIMDRVFFPISLIIKILSGIII